MSKSPDAPEDWNTMRTPDAEMTVPKDKPSEPPKVQAAGSAPEAAPKRFEQTVLLLQGGGALGSYQAGVYQALAEANLHPDWVAGISIGAVNSALIVGNPPEKRVERLREFWEAVSMSRWACWAFRTFRR
jgi:NTE family protein